MKKLLLLVALVFPFTLEAQDLFKYVKEEKALAQISHTEGVRSVRRIEVSHEALRSYSFNVSIAGSEKIAFLAEDTEERIGADFVSRFRVGTSEGVSTVTRNFGHIAGVIYDGDRVFEIRPDGDGHILLEYSSASFECGARAPDVGTTFLESAVTALTSTTRRRSVGRGILPSKYRIDLAEGYTDKAAAAVGGNLQIEAMIQNGVDTLNTVVRNSGINNVEFRLVGTRQFIFDESGNNEAIINRLSSTSEFTGWRDSLGADLVGMQISARSSAAYIPYGMSFGKATSIHFVSATASTPFALRFAHEVGHNLGMEHNREHANVNDPSASNYGWYDCSARWATVMSYPQACEALNVEPTRIPYFSNPDVKYNGLPTGIAKANNVARLLVAAPYVSAYSPSGSK